MKTTSKNMGNGIYVDVSGNRLPFKSQSINNFCGIDISQPTPSESLSVPLFSLGRMNALHRFFFNSLTHSLLHVAPTYTTFESAPPNAIKNGVSKNRKRRKRANGRNFNWLKNLREETRLKFSSKMRQNRIRYFPSTNLQF